MKKSFFHCCAYILACVCLLCACSRPEILNPKQPVTITIWHYYAPQLAAVIDEYVTDFNNSAGLEQGIVVEALYREGISNLTSDIMDASAGKIGASPLPDLVFAYKETAFEIDRLGNLVDLNEYFTAEELAEYIPAYLNEGINEDKKLLNFPVAKSTECLYVDMVAFGAFEQAANNSGHYPPVHTSAFSTFEGLMELAQIYYAYTDGLTLDVPYDGRAFWGMDSVPNYVQVAAKQLGTSPVEKRNGEAGFSLDTAAARRMWDFYYGGFAAGHMYSFSNYGSEDMKAGDIIAYIGSTGGARHFPTEVFEEDHARQTELAVFPYPVFKGAAPAAVQQGAGISMIKTTPKRQQAAAIFLKWFTDAEQNTAYAIRSGYLPVKIEAAARLSALQETISADDILSEHVTMVLEVAAQMTADYDFATTMEFPGAYETRSMFGDTLKEAAIVGQADVAARIQAGETLEQALSSVVTDAAFKNWYAQIQSQFVELTKERSESPTHDEATH